MLLASRPCAVAFDGCKLELLVLSREHPRRTVGWVIGGTTAHRLIDHVDDIALLDKKLGPAFATIGCPHPVGRRLRRAVNQDERIRPSLYLWRQNLDIDLRLHDVLARLAHIMTPDIKKAAPGDGRLIDSGDRKLHLRQRRWPDQRHHGHNASYCRKCAQSGPQAPHDFLPAKFPSRHKLYHPTCRLSRR